jgi:hypothetical protein
MSVHNQEAQYRLDLVKRNAHTIIGCKREQVHRVVENISRPGEYEITVHRDGRVEFHNWTPPAEEEVFAFVNEEQAQDFVDEVSAENLVEVEEPEVVDTQAFSEEVIEEGNAVEVSETEEQPLAEGQEVVPAPNVPAAATAPAPTAAAPRRGRPKKTV